MRQELKSFSFAWLRLVIAGFYLCSFFSSTGPHLHGDTHSHEDGSEPHHHLVLHSHSDLIPTAPVSPEIETPNKEHQHPLGKSPLGAFFQPGKKKQRFSGPKKYGFGPTITPTSPLLIFSTPVVGLWPTDESPPKAANFSASSERAPPLA